MCELSNTGSVEVIKNHQAVFLYGEKISDSECSERKPQYRYSVPCDSICIYELDFKKQALESVDECLVDIIDELNKNEHFTISSCCGHNRHPPDILLYTKSEKKSLKIIEKYWEGKIIYSKIDRLS